MKESRTTLFSYDINITRCRLLGLISVETRVGETRGIKYINEAVGVFMGLRPL
jgi:hypothetical protein